MHPSSTTPTHFRFVGGHPALDFVNTTDRDGDRLVNDRFASLDDVVHWATSAGILDGPAATRIRGWGRQDSELATMAHSRALDSRELIHRVFAGVVPGPADHVALADLDRVFQRMLARRHLAAGPGGATWRWEPVERELVEILGPLAIAAVELLTAPAELETLRRCDGPACGWLYLDRSRNGRRRWCEMRSCGAQAKSRRQYARRRQAS
jgi:predicted RNA-binding Zn ribbon-like protein